MERYFSENKDFSEKLKSFFDKRSNRRSGRSFLMARILIELSIEAGQEMSLVDHVSLFEEFNLRKYELNFNIELEKVLTWYRYQGVDIDIIRRNMYGFSCRITSGIENYGNIRINTKDYTIEKEIREFNYKLLFL